MIFKLKRLIIFCVEVLVALIARKNKEAPRSVSIMEVQGLGDVVCSFAVVRHLLKIEKNLPINVIVPSFAEDLFVNSRINVVTCDVPWAKPTDKYNIRKIFCSLMKFREDVKKYNIDLVFEARGDIRKILFLKCAGVSKVVSYNTFLGGNEALHSSRLLHRTIQYPSKLLHRVEEHVELVSRYYEIEQVADCNNAFLLDPDLRFGFSDSPVAPTRKSLVVHLGGGNQFKLWPLSKWLLLIQNVHFHFDQVFVIVGPGERSLAQEFCSRLEVVQVKAVECNALSDLGRFFQRAGFFVGAGSGPLHLADACGMAVVGLYGSTVLDLWFPWKNGKAAALHIQDKCAACRPTHITYNIDDRYCTRLISEETVRKAVMDMVARVV